MKRLLFYSLASLLMGLCIYSCYPDGPDSTTDYDVAITTYDRSLPDTFWTSLNTFAMPDSIVYVSSSSSYTPSAVYDSTILLYVSQKFEDVGFYQVSDNLVNPDFVVTLTMNIDTYYNWNYDWYDYWGWYPGWSSWWNFNGSWTPYWNSGIVYAYRNGSLIVDMLTPVTSADTTALSVVWSGIADGVLVGSESSLVSRTESMIEQCFEQSPYLTK